MRRWERAAAEVACGLCGTRLVVDTPVLKLVVGPVINDRDVRRTYVFWRCVACAGEPPPTWAAPVAAAEGTHGGDVTEKSAG
jgi:hypothetical protein